MLMKCILTQQGKDLLLEIHAGICGHHEARRSLIGKAFCQGFYWPTKLHDVEEVIRTCKRCQFYTQQTHLPVQALQTIPFTWPFVVWGLDMVRPLKRARGGFTHLLIVVDKFTEWIEAKPIAKTNS
jgi:transposase InsO family protein